MRNVVFESLWPLSQGERGAIDRKVLTSLLWKHLNFVSKNLSNKFIGTKVQAISKHPATVKPYSNKARG